MTGAEVTGAQVIGPRWFEAEVFKGRDGLGPKCL